jgi:hypothetical protein
MEVTQVPWMQNLIEEANRDSAAAALGSVFLTATGSDRAAVFNGWDFAVEWPYPTPARLACTNGEHTSPRERIISSLVLDSLERVVGTREHLIALSATYRSCELAGLSPSEIFESVAAVLPSRDAQILRAFLGRRAEDRALSAFGLAERVNADGEVEVHPE